MASFCDLPIEMMDIILEHLPTKELLDLRHVSRVWNFASSRICLARCTQLKKLVETKQRSMSNLFSVFFGTSVWSGVSISFWKDEEVQDAVGISQVDTRKLLEAYGSSLKMVNLDGDDVANIASIFTLIPNVERLSFNSTLDSLMANIQLHQPFDRLQIVQLSLTSVCDFKFLQYLLSKCIVPLRKLKLKVSMDWDVVLEENDTQLITHFGYLIKDITSIDFEYDSLTEVPRKILKVFSTVTMNITELVLFLDDYNLGEEDDIMRLIECFLAQMAPRLRKLLIPQIYGIRRDTRQIELPTFPKVWSIQIEVDSGYNLAEDFLLPFKPFTSTNFKILNTVTIFNAIDPSPLFHEFVNATGTENYKVFESVHILTLGSPCLKTLTSNLLHRWHLLFPNLTRLELSDICTSGLEYIFSRMTGLTHLTARLFEENVVEDFNEVLSGISRPDDVHLLSECEIEQLVQKRSRPSIVSMTCLNFLTLTVPTLRDSGVTLSLLKMKPLYSLDLYGTQISKECKERLTTYHFIFRNHD